MANIAIYIRCLPLFLMMLLATQGCTETIIQSTTDESFQPMVRALVGEHDCKPSQRSPYPSPGSYVGIHGNAANNLENRFKNWGYQIEDTARSITQKASNLI